MIGAPDDQNQHRLHARKEGQDRHCHEVCRPDPPLAAVMHALRPAHQAQQAEELWLYLNGDVEVLDDGVDAKRNPSEGPEEHHGGGETFRRLRAVIADDLRDQLDAPAYRADCAQDVC